MTLTAPNDPPVEEPDDYGSDFKTWIVLLCLFFFPAALGICLFLLLFVEKNPVRRAWLKGVVSVLGAITAVIALGILSAHLVGD